MIQLCNSISPDEVIKRYAVIVRKLYRRPERYFTLARFVTAVDGELHIEYLGDIFLRFVVILAKIADAFINEHTALQTFSTTIIHK